MAAQIRQTYLKSYTTTCNPLVTQPSSLFVQTGSGQTSLSFQVFFFVTSLHIFPIPSCLCLHMNGQPELTFAQAPSSFAFMLMMKILRHYCMLYVLALNVHIYCMLYAWYLLYALILCCTSWHVMYALIVL